MPVSKGIAIVGGPKGKHYPSQHKYKEYDHWNDLRIAYDMIYHLQTQLLTMGKQLAAFTSGAADGGSGAGTQTGSARAQAGSPLVSPAEVTRMQKVSISNTFLGGIRLKGVPPKNGQVPTYNSATGQVEWT